ncbi:MAG: HEAT repeat domain-containing protein, partial [Candidatus Sericytochromatia bacterium]
DLVLLPRFRSLLAAGLIWALLVQAAGATHLDTLSAYESLPANVKTAAALLGPQKALPFLIERLADPEENAEDVVMALDDLTDPRSTEALIRLGLRHEDAHVRMASARALARLGAQGAVPGLMAMLADPDTEAVALEALGDLKATTAVPQLLAHGQGLLARSREDVSCCFLNLLCKTLGRIGDARAIPFLRQVIALPDDTGDGLVGPQSDAAWALARLGDQAAAGRIAELSYADNALRLLHHPLALQHARATLAEALENRVSGGELYTSLQTLAEIGAPQDRELITQLLEEGALKRVMATSLGTQEAYAQSTTANIQSEDAEVFAGWALLGLGDKAGEALLDQALQGEEALAASEAARIYVRLGRSDKYPLIATAFRRLVERNDYYSRSGGAGDLGIHARVELVQMLAPSPAALKLLVALLNDSNINMVLALRQKLRQFPPAQVLAALEAQLPQATDWELFQLLTQISMMGEDGYVLIARLARSSVRPALRALAVRALAQAEAPGWQDLLAAVPADGPYAEAREWACIRWQETEPGLIGNCKE